MASTDVGSASLISKSSRETTCPSKSDAAAPAALRNPRVFGRSGSVLGLTKDLAPVAHVQPAGDTIERMPLLSRADILHAFDLLARELEATGAVPRYEIVIAGGAALVLLYGAREATRDVDALLISPADPTAIRQAAERVALALNLPADWLNDGAKGYFHGVLPGKVLLDRPGLLIRALGPQQLLAMKLSAWRDDVDISDARLLMRDLPPQRERTWTMVEPFVVPGRELKAKYAFDDLWESEHGS
jgi:hypothetical protein